VFLRERRGALLRQLRARVATSHIGDRREYGETTVDGSLCGALRPDVR
jgi:hypothetical protein